MYINIICNCVADIDRVLQYFKFVSFGLKVNFNYDI